MILLIEKYKTLTLPLVTFVFFSLLLTSLSAEETQAPIGEAPTDQLSHLFLRDSEVLLKPRQIQFSIGFNYNSDESQLSFRQNRSRSLSIPLSITYGLTENLEVNATLPLQHKRNEVIAPTNVSKTSQSGIGDLSLGLSYKLKPETASSPSITSSFEITTPTGKEADSSDSPSIGSGFWGLSSSIHASKSVDPAVIFANLGYQHRFKDTVAGSTVQPGSTVTYGLGAGLSINSSVSFSGRISGNYQFETKRNGQKVIGSNMEPISFIAGMSYRVSPRSRLETNVDFGLSEDAGDIGISTSYIWDAL